MATRVIVQNDDEPERCIFRFCGQEPGAGLEAFLRGVVETQPVRVPVCEGHWWISRQVSAVHLVKALD